MARASELLVPLGDALYRQPTWPDATALARHLDTSPSALAPWVNFLSFHRVLRPAGRRLEADEDRLLHVLTAHRLANLRPEAPFATELDVREVHHRLDAQHIPHCFGMFSAANEWAFFEPRRDIHVYAPRSVLPRLRNALAPTPGRRREPGGQLQIYVESTDRIAMQPRNGLPVTTPFQTVLDLRAHPEGGAHAAFLQEKLLPRLRGTLA